MPAPNSSTRMVPFPALGNHLLNGMLSFFTAIRNKSSSEAYQLTHFSSSSPDPEEIEVSRVVALADEILDPNLSPKEKAKQREELIYLFQEAKKYFPSLILTDIEQGASNASENDDHIQLLKNMNSWNLFLKEMISYRQPILSRLYQFTNDRTAKQIGTFKIMLSLLSLGAIVYGAIALVLSLNGPKAQLNLIWQIIDDACTAFGGISGGNHNNHWDYGGKNYVAYYFPNNCCNNNQTCITTYTPMMNEYFDLRFHINGYLALASLVVIFGVVGIAVAMAYQFNLIYSLLLKPLHNILKYADSQAQKVNAIIQQNEFNLRDYLVEFFRRFEISSDDRLLLGGNQNLTQTELLALLNKAIGITLCQQILGSHVETSSLFPPPQPIKGDNVFNQWKLPPNITGTEEESKALIPGEEQKISYNRTGVGI